jgi:hypothetical protein
VVAGEDQPLGLPCRLHYHRLCLCLAGDWDIGVGLHVPRLYHHHHETAAGAGGVETAVDSVDPLGIVEGAVVAVAVAAVAVVEEAARSAVAVVARVVVVPAAVGKTCC